MHEARHSERFSVAMGFQAGAVAGHDTIDFDAMAAEEAQRIEEEADTGFAFFIGKDFAIGKALVVIDDEVEISHPLPPFAASRLALSFAAAGDAVADAVDASQLFDVEVDHFAGGLFLVADDRRLGFKCRQAG